MKAILFSYAFLILSATPQCHHTQKDLTQLSDDKSLIVEAIDSRTPEPRESLNVATGRTNLPKGCLYWPSNTEVSPYAVKVCRQPGAQKPTHPQNGRAVCVWHCVLVRTRPIQSGMPAHVSVSLKSGGLRSKAWLLSSGLESHLYPLMVQSHWFFSMLGALLQGFQCCSAGLLFFCHYILYVLPKKMILLTFVTH